MDKPLLTFVHLSDSHLHRDPTYTGNHVTFSATDRTKAVITHIRQLPFQVDFVLHTGDVMNDPVSADEYRIAEGIFQQLNLPIYYLSGNHDIASMLRQVLANPSLSLPSDEKYYYQFDFHGIQFVCLDSSIPRVAEGEIDPQQMEWLSGICEAQETRPLVIAVHHHVLPIGVPWFDTMRIRNGDAVHQTLLKAKKRLRAVFYGHIHQNLHLVRDHISYFSTLSTWFELVSWHGQTSLKVDDDQTSGYNVVTLTEDDTFVRNFRVPV